MTRQLSKTSLCRSPWPLPPKVYQVLSHSSILVFLPRNSLICLAGLLRAITPYSLLSGPCQGGVPACICPLTAALGGQIVWSASPSAFSHCSAEHYGSTRSQERAKDGRKNAF